MLVFVSFNPDTIVVLKNPLIDTIYFVACVIFLDNIAFLTRRRNYVYEMDSVKPIVVILALLGYA